MKGKADMLVANRILSALVVVCLVVSAFAGLLVLMVSTPMSVRAASLGDLTISSGTYTIQNIEQPVDGNVTVTGTGNLTIRDATMSVISNFDPAQRHTIIVQGGGVLYLEHGTVTSYLDQINPWPFLDLVVQGGGHLIANGQSVLMFPGNIILSTGAHVVLHDTQIVKLPDSEVANFVVGTSGNVTFDSANDGPRMSITDSTLEMYDSSIANLPEYATLAQPASNITLGGSSFMLAVNSYIGVDFGPTNLASDWFKHNVLVLSGSAQAELYGCSFEPYIGNGADRQPAIVSSGSTFVGVPNAKGPEDNTGGNYVALQQNNEGLSYHVGPGQRMAIDGFTTGGSVPIGGATLLVRYMVDSGYNGNGFLNWSTNEGVTQTSTGIRPLSTDTSYVEKSYDLYAAGVTTLGAISTLDINFKNTGTSGDVQFDSMSIVITSGSAAHIYRWLNVTVGDAYGVPIPGAKVTAVFTGSTGYGGQESFYFGSSGAQPLPPNSVLAYMGKDASTFSTTEADGIATMPFLTDLITGTLGSSSLFVGTFALDGSAVINSVLYSSTESFSFPAYPAMGLGDRSFDVTVEITGVSAPSPDQARWLVVPVSSTQPNLTIEGMTYYHAGDVIVAAGGILTFDNAVFELVQAYPNQRTVYVDGTMAQPGKLVFENSAMNSDLGINIIVKGYAILEVLNSTFTGVNIIALDHSTVLLKNASVDQQISTAWDSHATIDVKDSTLDLPIVLSGYATGGFTNTSVPSIKVTDSAQALIYRWIHVTVFDGAGKPLPNATVSAYYLVNGTFAKSATTSSDPLSRGVAQVNALGTKITAMGSTFVGNYKVTAVYVWGSPAQHYWSDQNISVGVMPYSEPLGKNATYATMTISSALPHVFVNQAMGPIDASPASPVKGDWVDINATVNNSGPVGAYDVKVDFFDNGVLFDTVIIPEIKPGDHAVANGQWLAPPPVNNADTSHNISISVDPGVTNMTPVVGWTQVIVLALPDLYVLPEITVAAEFAEVDTSTTVTATILNNGDKTANVKVEFKDNGNLFYTINAANLSIPSNQQLSRPAPWTPTTTGTHIISVEASTVQTELNYSNNAASISKEVFPHPDLVLSNMAFVPTGSVAGGTSVIVQANLLNTGKVPISQPPIFRLEFSGTDVSMLPLNPTLPSVVGLNVDLGEVVIQASFTAPIMHQQTDLTVTATINPYGDIVESNYSNNSVVGHITVRDVRPDLSVLPNEISLTRGTRNVSALGEEFGRVVTITVDVQNLGGQPVLAPGFNMSIGVWRAANHNLNYTLFNVTHVVIGGNSTSHSTKITRNWTVSLTTTGLYEIWVKLDTDNTVDEPDNTVNNFAVTNFTLNPLAMNVIVTSAAGNEFKAGDFVTVSAVFTYTNGGEPVKMLPDVQFWLVDSTAPYENRILGSNSTIVSTDTDGQTITTLRAPVGMNSGSYAIRAYVGDANGTYVSATPIHVSAIKKAGLLPMWVWILIIIIAVAVVLGFLVYTYKYGLGKLVECGECGAFIPAASKRCPKCGVEFEVGTMKCSECGAWIPAESTECPNCGVKFVGETEGETDYLERMKKEYEEMTSKYREIAKGELGKKFTDKEFEDWFKRQPGYISFDDWLAKEEEKKMEGPIPCKVCGTLNPKEATVCHKCGTVFTKEEPPQKGQPPQGGGPTQAEAAAEPVAQPQPVAPRMVIRRPIDRKVVPKKIIKSPMTGESEEQQQ